MSRWRGGAFTARLFSPISASVLLRSTPVPRIAGQAGLVLALVFPILVPQQRIMRQIRYPVMQLEQSANREMWNSLQSVLPPSPGNKRILALHDPFEGPWKLAFLTQLGFNNSRIVVDTPHTLIHGGTDASYEDYDYVIDYDHGKFSRVAANDLTRLVSSRKCSKTQPLPPGKYDETDPRIVFLGPWIVSEDFPAAWSKTVTYTNDRNARACLSIEGSGFRYVYTRAFNRGIAEITVDGNPQPPVDLYGSTIGWQSKTVISGLSPGLHDVAIEVTGQKNPRAHDTYVDFDAVEVF